MNICPVNQFGGATWNRDGVIVFSQVSSLWTVPADGGTPQRFPIPAELGPDAVAVAPAFRPDQKTFTYRIGFGAKDSTGTYLAQLESRTSTRLFDLGPNVVLAQRHGRLGQQRRAADAGAGSGVAAADRAGRDDRGRRPRQRRSGGDAGAVAVRNRRAPLPPAGREADAPGVVRSRRPRAGGARSAAAVPQSGVRAQGRPRRRRVHRQHHRPARHLAARRSASRRSG